MTSYQNAIEYALDKLQRGLITADQANVLAVQIAGVVIFKKTPATVKKALDAAVKCGELGHIKKEGLRPEVYHHKNARPTAIEMREAKFRDNLEKLKKMFA